ncbi:J517_1871 family lipoprotein, partial [Acinetobacter sp. TUM15509]
VGPSSTVLSLNRQGSGMFCVDDGKELMSYKVKLVDSVLYTDQGIKFNVKELNNNNAKIHMSLLGLGGTFDLNKDDQLKHVTVRCKQVLSGS